KPSTTERAMSSSELMRARISGARKRVPVCSPFTRFILVSEVIDRSVSHLQWFTFEFSVALLFERIAFNPVANSIEFVDIRLGDQRVVVSCVLRHFYRVPSFIVCECPCVVHNAVRERGSRDSVSF